MSGWLINIYLNKLLKLQKRAVRHICKTSFRHSSIPLFRDLRILNVYNTYNLELGVFMYKYSTDDLPTKFNGYFSKQSQIHSRDTRNMTNYIWGKTEQILHPKEWKHLDLAFWILYLKKLNCLLMLKHLESNWKTTYFLPNNVSM